MKLSCEKKKKKKGEKDAGKGFVCFSSLVPSRSFTLGDSWLAGR
jgi:hypothetical protein